MSNSQEQPRSNSSNDDNTNYKMDDKNNVFHIEEQSTQVGDHSSKMELICDNGIVLIPQPTADPNGRGTLSRRAASPPY